VASAAMKSPEPSGQASSDADDPLDPGRALVDHPQDVGLDPVAGDHHPDPGPVEAEFVRARGAAPPLDLSRLAACELVDGRHPLSHTPQGLG